MSNIIATIALAPGRVGFFDPLSSIHLTLGNPTAHVYSGTNCANLRRNVKCGILRLLDGTLGAEVPPFKIVEVNGQLKLASNAAAEMKPVYAEEKADEKVPEKVEEAKAEKPAAPAKEDEPAETEAKAPEKVEEQVEEPKEVKKAVPKRKAAPKKKAAKAEEKQDEE